METESNQKSKPLSEEKPHGVEPKTDAGASSKRTQESIDLERAKGLLSQAYHHIKNIEASNQRMGLRLDMFDKMYTLFTARPNGEGVMSESQNITWQIDNFLNKE